MNSQTKEERSNLGFIAKGLKRERMHRTNGSLSGIEGWRKTQNEAR